MKTLIAIVFALTIYSPITYGELTIKQINEIEKGTCKVISQNGRNSASGSGFFFKQDDARYFICTNGHVVDGGTSFKIRRYENTNKTIEIPSTLIAKYYKNGTDLDFAFLTVDKRFFKSHPPKILKLASDIKLNKNTKVFGWGFPNGHGSHFWRHRVIKDNGNTIETNIAFASGQSGGPALSFVDGSIKVIGLVTWRYDDRDTGGIISVNKLWDVLEKKQTKVNVISRKHTLLQKVHTDSCSICGHPKEYHYQTINPATGKLSKELYCPGTGVLSNINCPNGKCPPNYYYNQQQRQPYYRYRGFEFGIGPRPQPQPQPKPEQPEISPNDDIWVDRDDESPKTDTPKDETPNQNAKLEKLKKSLADKTSELLILKEKYHSLDSKAKSLEKSGNGLSEQVSSLKKVNESLSNKVNSLIQDTKGKIKDILFGGSLGEWTSIITLIVGIAGGGSIPILLGRFFAKRTIGRMLGIVKKVKFFNKTTDEDGNDVIIPAHKYVIDDSFKMDKPKKKSKCKVIPKEEKLEDITEKTKEVYNTIDNSPNDVKTDVSSSSLEKQDINIENNHYISLDGITIPELNDKAKSRYEHITSEKFDKQQYYMGVLYEEAIIKLKNGHFRVIGDSDAASIIIDYVESKLADKIIEDGKIFDEVTSKNTKYYYVIKCMYYIEAMEKLKNKEFGDIKRPEDIARAIELFVRKKIINNYTK